MCNLPTTNRYSAASDIRRRIDSINEAVYIYRSAPNVSITMQRGGIRWCVARQESINRVFAFLAWPHQHVSLHANQCIILNWLQFGLPTCFASMRSDVRNYIFSIDSAGARFMLMPACNYYSIVIIFFCVSPTDRHRTSRARWSEWVRDAIEGEVRIHTQTHRPIKCDAIVNDFDLLAWIKFQIRYLFYNCSYISNNYNSNAVVGSGRANTCSRISVLSANNNWTQQPYWAKNNATKNWIMWHAFKLAL